MAEMRVHDARAAFRREPVLVRLTQGVQKSHRIRPFSRRVPGVDERLARIVVRHPRTGSQRIDVPVYEVAAVADPLAARIAPETGGARDVPEMASIRAARG